VRFEICRVRSPEKDTSYSEKRENKECVEKRKTDEVHISGYELTSHPYQGLLLNQGKHMGA
jgi:hypothetical protein